MEPWSFEIPTLVFNITLLCVFAAVPAVILVVSRRPDWGDGRAYATSMRARLPFGTDAVHRSVRARLRSVIRANMWGLFVAIVVMGVLFLTTPLATSPYAMWILSLILLMVVLAGGTLAAQLRERLFSPVPQAPRVARPVALRTRDYLGLWRTRVPVVLLVAAVLATAALSVTTILGVTALAALLSTAGALLLAIAATAGTRWAERRILDQPQPASDTLELAWDDLFRADALSTLRMSASMTAWLPFGMATTLLVSLLLPAQTPELATLLGLFPWWGIPLLQVLYTLGTGKLPAALYPEFLRTPAPAPVAS